MNRYSFTDRRVFSRGFILTSYPSPHLETAFSGPFYRNTTSWQKTYFAKYTLWADRNLDYQTTRDPKHGVGVLGFCIDPFSEKTDNLSISKQLYDALKCGVEQFYETLDQLSGSFIIIFRINDNVRVIQDAASTKPVFYTSPERGCISVASHANLVAKLHGLARNPAAEEVLFHPQYRSDPSRYLPGLLTPYKELFPLTANHELHLTEAKSRRFFPRQELQENLLDNELIESTVKIMRKQAELISGLGRPIYLAATGGKDSRTSAATFSGLANVEYFSFHIPARGHLTGDVKIAGELARIADVKLSIFDLTHYTELTQEAFATHSPLGIWRQAADCYTTEFDPAGIHIRSTVSEIGRCFYRRRGTNISSANLASTYTSTEMGKSPAITKLMQDFIDQTDFDEKKFFNYNPYDLFYWEHRNSKWQNILCSEAEMATDVFIPFNNRKLLKLFLSIPLEQRLTAELHRAIWKFLTPKFDEIDFA